MNTGTEFWQSLEIGLVALVILLQLFLSIKVYIKIGQLKRIFTNPLTINYKFVSKKVISLGESAISSNYLHPQEDQGTDGRDGDSVKLTIVESSGKNRTVEKITNRINRYLFNNFGAAVNFSIIKDIIDRELDVRDEEITSKLSVPLYLGLAATMAGIIFGLLSLPSLDGDGFSSGVGILINGVKWAMGASLFGLLCTTVLSSIFYQTAKDQLLEDKNEQLSYLQAKLLPELIKAEDTGVSGLKASLDQFARVATNISDNVAVAALQVNENLVLQQEIFERVEESGMLKLSKTNLELFQHLDRGMDSFHKFSTYLERMEAMTLHLVEFSKRTGDLDKITHDISNTLDNSNKLFQFLTNHFEKIEASGNQALKAVGLADSHFEQAVLDFREKSKSMIDSLQKEIGLQESNLEQVLHIFNHNLRSATTEHIKAFSVAYSEAVPRFGQLDHLALLPQIHGQFATTAKQRAASLQEHHEGVLNGLGEVNDNIQSLSTGDVDREIVNELGSINSHLKEILLRMSETAVSNGIQQSHVAANGSSIKEPPGPWWKKLRSFFLP